MKTFDKSTSQMRATKCIALVCYSPVRYLARSGWDRDSGYELECAAEELASSGYTVIPYETGNGRDVQCMPLEDAPIGSNCPDVGPVWAVQHRHDDYWCLGATLNAALQNAGWSRAELQGVRV